MSPPVPAATHAVQTVSMTFAASMKRTPRRRELREVSQLAFSLPCFNTAVQSGPAKESRVLITAGAQGGARDGCPRCPAVA
eukprot:2224285-Alexandrium_andersonii.AAC.1